MIQYIKILFFTVILMLVHPLYADVINSYIERLGSGTVKDINCQDYTITAGALLDVSGGGVLREVTTFTNNGTWDYGSGQIVELGAWINNGTVAIKPTQIGTIPNLQFTTMCGPISIKGTSDTDGDGISDADEGDNAVALGHGITLDQDGDGIYNFLDDDSDNDGLLDSDEGDNSVDSDGDGIPDYLDKQEGIASISITKYGTFSDENNNGFADIGESIVYEFNITNTGTMQLSNINLVDDNADIYGNSIPTLAPGESKLTAFTAKHILTLQDIIDAKVMNQATVTAEDILGHDVNNTSDDPTNPVSKHDVTQTRFTIKPPIAVDNNVSSSIGEVVDIDVVSNDNNGFFELNASSVRIINPQTGEKVRELFVAGEGKWAVDENTGHIYFTPIQGYVGDPISIEYSVEDTQGTEVRASINLDYTPVAYNDTVDAKIGHYVIIHILNNDKPTSQSFKIDSIVITDINGTIIGSNNEGKELIVDGEGIWTVNGDGTITFDPENGFMGNPTSIWYKLKDTRGDFTNIAQVSIIYIRVTPTPTPTPIVTPTPTPIVTPIVTSTPISNSTSIGENDIIATDNLNVMVAAFKPTVIDILGNGDSFGDAGACGLSFTQPSSGRVDVDNGGTPQKYQDDILIYTPNKNIDVLTDSFEYTITDCAGNSDSALVTLDIQCDTIKSDDVNTLGKISILLMTLLTISIGLIFIGKEQTSNRQ